MGGHAGSSSAILEGVDLESLLVGSTHGALDAAVGQKASQDDVSDAMLVEEKFQVGRSEAAQSRLALDDQLAVDWLHWLVHSGAIASGLEGASFLDSS